MSESNPPEARSYHHGDLRRALVDAARRLVESEGGSAAMSLRAVAREAGVSPAAPYHHFKDKSELMGAVAAEGWALVSTAVFEASQANPGDQLAPALAYVTFARERPALYRVMFDNARDAESLPFFGLAGDGSPYAWVREALDKERQNAGGYEVELGIAAVWCAAHGLAEMACFKQFDPIKESLGGERPFLEAVLEHMGVHSHRRE
ncbi:TetR/AcrR family transcriptional regulator [Phenylobacterium sp. LjRoot219]|uniref:TetR/AcrR family transcriptional regulator n=1 Tax=Phenylobacterium sp. LjRoot219 TaxID=3342283 RepID=UPI003ECFBECC